MITVTVYLYGTLPRRFEDYDPKQGYPVALDQGADISDLLGHLGFARENVAPVINGIIADRGRKLADGDRVRLFQPVQGG
ncbi:MAG: MoaD/ThiS family protein [Desulfobacteraceae bacterium]|nr:MoaD/ThiS family protein [Desulfobacteraceae bacterium]